MVLYKGLEHLRNFHAAGGGGGGGEGVVCLNQSPAGIKGRPCENKAFTKLRSQNPQKNRTQFTVFNYF